MADLGSTGNLAAAVKVDTAGASDAAAKDEGSKKTFNYPLVKVGGCGCGCGQEAEEAIFNGGIGGGGGYSTFFFFSLIISLLERQPTS